MKHDPNKRLKFAFARGARIQWHSGADGWLRAAPPTWLSEFTHRIHPDDAHLEYGPLSSTIREEIINGIQLHTISDFYVMATDIATELIGGRDVYVHCVEPLDFQMVDMLLAEVLADEGL